MIIKDTLLELASKNKPIAKVLHKGLAFRVIVLAFKKGMVLREHKATIPTKLIVINGQVNFISNTEKTNINQYEEFEISINEMHSLEALEDSLCILIHGYRN